MASRTGEPTVYVIATTEGGTARALDEARRRTASVASIFLIVPVILPAGGSTVETTTAMNEFDAVATRAGVRMPYICPCRHPREALSAFPIDDATLIVGSDAPGDPAATPERDLASQLAREGHRVIFADAAGAGPVASADAPAPVSPSCSAG
jgi:hypothetical protein